MKGQAELDTIVAGLRDAHRELHQRLTNRAMHRIIARERIPLIASATLAVPAMTMFMYGRAAILFNPDKLRNPREETAVLAEEYAHAVLHAGELGEVPIHLSSCISDDPREYEADYVARCLVAGPGVDVAYFTPQPKRRRHSATQPVVPIVGPLFDPYTEHAKSYGGPRSREPKYAGQSHHIRRGPVSEHRGSFRMFTGRSFGPDRRDDPNGLLEFSPDGKCTRYRHPQFGRWTVWDVAYFTIDGVRRRFVMTAGQAEGAVYRQFRAESGAVRIYQFGRLEPRAFETKHLERQIRQAVVQPQRRLAQEKTG